MFDIGWSEMMLIIMVMVIVIGPKDLPRVMRTAGQWIGRARAVARHFQESIERMADEAGVEDVRKELNKASRIDVRGEIERTIDPKGELREGLSVAPGKPQPRDEAAEAMAPTVEGPSAVRSDDRAERVEAPPDRPAPEQDGRKP